MKKIKTLLAAMLGAGLALSGCTFEEGLETAKNWMNESIIDPTAGFIDNIFPKKDDQEEKPEKEQGGDDDQGGGGEIIPEATLESISVSGQFKQNYELGEEFDSTGIVVTAEYSDQSTKDVSSEASFSGFSSESKGEVEITVTFEDKTASFTIEIVKTQWDAETRALMEENLHGLVLPYIDKEGMTWELSNGWLVGSGATVEGDELANYQALFSASEGYSDITNEYENVTDNRFMAFKKSVVTEEGTRYVDVLVFATASGSSSYATEGDLHIQAMDAYEYEFPNMSALFEKYPALTEFDVPSLDLPDGGYYYVAEYQYNESYYQYGVNYNPSYFQSMYLDVWGYNATQETFDSFLAGFEGWTVSESSGSYTAKKNVSSAQFAKVTFSFDDASGIIRYRITLGLFDNPVWPTAGAASLVQAVASGSNTVIPECPGAEKYTVYTSLSEIDAKGPESLLDEYAQILRDNFWEETSEGSYQFISPYKDVLVSLDWNSTYGVEIVISAYSEPSYVWPAEELSAAFAAAGEPEFAIPALEGEGFEYEFNDSYISSYGVAVIYVSGSASADDLAPYAELFEGWDVTEEDGKYYASLTTENGIQNVEFSYSDYYDEISIYVTLQLAPLPAPEWPAEGLAGLFPNATDSIPAFEGEATGYQFFENYGSVVISVAEGTEADAISSYQQTLGTNLWFSIGEDSEGDEHFVSPNFEIEAVAYKYDEGSICILFGQASVFKSFPLDVINDFMDELGFGFSFSADMFENIETPYFGIETGSNGGYAYTLVYFEGSYADALNDVIAPIVLANGFENYADYGYYYYNGAYSSVYILEDGGNTILQIME